MSKEPYVLSEKIIQTGYELVEAGQVLGTLVKLKMVGPQAQLDFQTGLPKLDASGNKVTRETLYLEFEVDQKDSAGIPKRIRRYMVASVTDPRHALRQMIEDWTGNEIEPDGEGYVHANLGELLGKTALLVVKHKQKQDGTPKHVIHKVLPTEKSYEPSVAIDNDVMSEYREYQEAA